MIIGIDLGTTNSVAAYLAEDGPRLIANALGDRLTPSVVGVEGDGKILVGRTAKEYQVLEPGRCASTFNRYMGSDWSLEIEKRKFTPEKLSSLVLRTLKQDAEAHFGHAIDQAVISVPAYFNEHQRKATIRAGEIAGLKVQRILNEPTAAAIAYGFHESKDEKVIVVIDLGGGTFDVSVVELFEGTMEVRASSGESFLGGEDFTNAMVARVLQRRGVVFERAELESPAMISRLRQQCEVAKLRLSRETAATVRVPNNKGDLIDDKEEPITREDFQKWTEHILTRIELPIRRALGDAQLKRGDVQEVILVGGATRMPAFVERVTELFGKEPRCRLNPDEVVALGAAVQAGLIMRDERVRDLVVTDVAPFTLGIEISRRFGLERREGYFMPIIQRNTTLPVSRVERVSTVRPNQTEVTVSIYQGENRKVKENLFLGQFGVEGIPRGPAGQGVDIRFTYDLNGVLEVEATIVETKKKITHIITRHAKGMSADAVAKAVTEMQGLKSHPREEAENRFLMRQAERLYQELPMFAREALTELLDGFEEAMDIGDKESIVRHRAALKEFLDRNDPETQQADGESW